MNALLAAFELLGVFATVGIASYVVAMLSSLNDGLVKDREAGAENERNIRRLLREISGFVGDIGVRFERNVKIRQRIEALDEELVKRARSMHELVTTRDGELRARGMTPERLGPGWGAYFDGASKGELDRIMLRM